MGWFRQIATSVAGHSPQPADDARLYIIGDIHGCYDLLTALIDQLSEDAAQFDDKRQPLAIFLGDYVDRGDQVREVLTYLEALEAAQAHAVFLRGNHEDALLRFLDDPLLGRDWLNFGAARTLASYGIAPVSARSWASDLEKASAALRTAMGSHVDFLKRTQLMFRSGDVLCAHSGVDPKRPVEEQSEDALLWGRSSFIRADGVTGLRVVHGHWADDEPVLTRGRICVDTGAYYTGRLTAVRLDQRAKIVTADAARIPEVSMF